MVMTTIQIRVDEQLKKEAFQAFEKLNLSPSDALRLFLRYVAENKKLPFTEVSVVVSESDADDEILAVVRERLKKPAKRIRVNLDDI
ncbi:antitoxin RelB [Providencia rustigianii DSM 4541]|uniref:Antitoxin RelB n=2 Tax=Providencia rustigianii TaxID=158850 RepID=D1P2U8_9GAMM|nr:antitoxin RelB [Providencia rustigianii DSM 4541]